jgi:myo-inositol-1(or 4)-monophosphatase
MDTSSIEQAASDPQVGKVTDTLRQQLVELVDVISAGAFSKTAAVRDKGDDGVDLVTSIDYELQELLVARLPRLLPGSKVVGEEEFVGLDTSCRYVWLVDPLDGTVNFVAGLPFYSVAVALLDRGLPVLAAVSDVPHAITYSALRGGGAMRNDMPLKVADNKARLGAMSSGLIRNLASNAPDVLAELVTVWKLRNLGSQALQLCYLAEGSLKFVASYEARAWDDIAGGLIAREAGLVYGHYSGGLRPAADAPQMSLCARADLFDELAAQLAKSVTEPGPELTIPSVGE